jgi:hypothetical protein
MQWNLLTRAVQRIWHLFPEREIFFFIGARKFQFRPDFCNSSRQKSVFRAIRGWQLVCYTLNG